MEQIIKELIFSLIAILASVTGLVIAWIESKKRKLEEKEHIKTKNELTKERNGFRDQIRDELIEVNKEIKELKTDMKLIKGLVVENKKHYKELEHKK